MLSILNDGCNRIEWGSNPLAISTQLAFCLAVALLAISATLHWRCRRCTRAGLSWHRLTLICSGRLPAGKGLPNAIRQVIAGTRVGGKLNTRDLTSPHARLSYRVIVERLDRFDRKEGEWREVLVEDRRATPADIAAARIDLTAWFRSLSGRHRRIAKALAMGDTTSEAARRFGVSLARISQFRRELRANWEEFQGGGDLCAGQGTAA